MAQFSLAPVAAAEAGPLGVSEGAVSSQLSSREVSLPCGSRVLSENICRRLGSTQYKQIHKQIELYYAYSVYVYIYVYIYIYVHITNTHTIHIYIYIYRERERDMWANTYVHMRFSS